MIDGALDIAIMVIMAYFLLRGALRGLVKEVVAIVGLLVAFWLAGIYGPVGAEHLITFDENQTTREVISFLVIFLVIYFIIGLISIFADKIVKITLTPMGSSLLGAVAGCLKGILMCAVLLMAAESFLKPDNPLFKNSAIWPVAKPVVNQVKAFVPENLRKLMNNPAAGVSGLLSNLGQQGTPDAASSQPFMRLQTLDWKSVQQVLISNPGAITPAWRDKLRGIDPSVGLTPEELQRFAADNKQLFELAPAPQSIIPAPPAVSTPNWAQPAGE